MNIVDTLYNYFQSQQREPEAQKEVTFAPSYLSACGRQIYYKKTGHTPSDPPSLPAFFKMHFGSVQHQEIQRILEECGLLTSHEVHRQKEFNGLLFNYYYDGIIEGNTILEIKTTYSRGMDAIADHPKQEHIIQTLTYCYFEELPKAIILYVGRDNGYMVQHEVECRDKSVFINGVEYEDYRTLWMAHIERMTRLKANIEEGVLPERDFNAVFKNTGNSLSDSFQKDSVKYKTDWQCSYCAFKQQCWSDVIKKMAKHKFYIDGKFIG